MENKIQELTDKIYREGVEKGNAQAQALIAKAQEEAKTIVESAQKKADAVIEAARKTADELTENSKSELARYGAQAVNALKNEVTGMLSEKIASAEVASLKGDGAFMSEFLLTLARQWSSEEPITISTGSAESLKAYFAARAKDLLDGKVTIELQNSLKTQFTIAPKDGSYRVDFGPEEFENYLKDFLRPQLVELLFK